MRSRVKPLVAAVISTLTMAAMVPSGAIATPTERIGERTSMLVHVREGVSLKDGVRVARAAGLVTGTHYPRIGVFVALGDRDAFERMERSAIIDYLEGNRPLSVLTSTSHIATRGNFLLEDKIKLKHVDGPIDGTGVGVAVVDTGVDGTHPDLASRMGGNVRIVCTGPGTVVGSIRECLGAKQAVPLDDTDTPGAGGHGTHVAGIVAGTGDTFHGAAPGATLYGVGIGTVLLVENALDGLAWVLENHDQVTPKIRVVNNSWGGGYFPPEDPAVSAVTEMVNLLVKEGVTVVFAAGNAGGAGAAPTTSGECVNPTPGVVCVANYDDQDSGTRDGSIDPSSSRGKVDDPLTWPDLSAPGTKITSTCRGYLVVCAALGGTQATDLYGTLSGTSMAAPHVSGIIAQLLQAAPSLKPAQIESILENSAYRFVFGGKYEADPTNHKTPSSFDKGHGLVDVVAAVKMALAIVSKAGGGR